MNYQIECEKIISNLQHPTKRLLLHSCCAPCSSYVLIYLRHFFEITVFYYNPNITLVSEYNRRVQEQKRLIEMLNEPLKEPIKSEMERRQHAIMFVEGKYDTEHFLQMAKGQEQEPEGGRRCILCYEHRLRETAVFAKENKFDYFTTTLSISPLKNALTLNEIGMNLEQEYGVSYLLSDFKKKDGYKQSIELSKKYNLYRQDYCGCVFSREANIARNDREETYEQDIR